MEKLSKELSRSAEKVPNRIPVSMAMAKLEKEFTAPKPLEEPPAEDRSSAAGLFRRAVIDPSRAALTLAGAPAWRGGAAELARLLVSGVPSNGFSVQIGNFSPSEWQELFQMFINRKR